MPNILTQTEIDELLNALSSNSDVEPMPEADDDMANVRPYDFRAANRFPKEQMRTLSIVFDTFSTLFTNQITNILRTNCECELLSVEEMSFNEFNNSLPIPVILEIFKCSPMQGSQLIEVSPEAAYMIINRLLGGVLPGSDSGKQFTEIELALVERVLRQMMRAFDEAWDKVLKVEAKHERIETSSQFAQIVALNEPIAIVTLNLSIGVESGLISICIPHSSIEPVAKMLSTKSWYSGTQETNRSDAQVLALAESLSNTEVSMTAYFEETSATVMDIANLHVGDVIRLNQNIKQPLLVKVQHIPKFYANIGTQGSQFAVQIVDIIQGENEDESVAG